MILTKSQMAHFVSKLGTTMNSPQKHTNPQSPFELLTRWTKRLRESQFAHYEAAKQLDHLNYVLGIPSLGGCPRTHQNDSLF
jgi:hypothetical protein